MTQDSDKERGKAIVEVLLFFLCMVVLVLSVSEAVLTLGMNSTAAVSRFS